MALIKNVQLDTCDVDPFVLSSSGVSSCIGVVIELQTKIFIYHAVISIALMHRQHLQLQMHASF